MTLDSLLTKSLFVGLVFSTGCMMGEGTGALNGSSSGTEQAGEFDRDDCKIEGSDIGVEGLVLSLGRISVTFNDWVSKDGETGEYVGFSITVTGADRVGYVVKASGESYHSEDSTWVHPNGTGGSNAPAISNVDFCENYDPNDPNYDPNDPNSPTCNDPDGCDGNPGSYDPNDPNSDPYDPNSPSDPTCNDPDGCNNDPGTGCTDPNGCNTCVDHLDCGANEFCNDYGICLPYVE